MHTWWVNPDRYPSEQVGMGPTLSVGEGGYFTSGKVSPPYERLLDKRFPWVFLMVADFLMLLRRDRANPKYYLYRRTPMYSHLSKDKMQAFVM